MANTAKIKCTGADGVARDFDVEYEKSQFKPEWDFRVFSIPRPASGEFFDCSVAEVDQTSVQVIAIANHGKNGYSAKGIPDALIPFIAKALNRRVLSSPTNGGAGTWRTVDATKMWDRLKANGLANYDPVQDIYSHPK